MPRKPLSKKTQTVLVINGKLITKGDMLANKHRRQRDQLLKKRQPRTSTTKPAFVWTFLNPRFPYGGWWMYVRTLRRSWALTGKSYGPLILAAMELFPCGISPALENFRLWKKAFAMQYPRATVKRPRDQGMALVSAIVSARGDLLNVSAIQRGKAVRV